MVEPIQVTNSVSDDPNDIIMQNRLKLAQKMGKKKVEKT